MSDITDRARELADLLLEAGEVVSKAAWEYNREVIEKHITAALQRERDEAKVDSVRAMNVAIDAGISAKARAEAAEARVKELEAELSHGILDATALLVGARAKAEAERDAAIDAYNRRTEELHQAEAAERAIRGLLDGAMPVVELWPAKTPAQIEWRLNWLANTRAALQSQGETIPGTEPGTLERGR